MAETQSIKSREVSEVVMETIAESLAKVWFLGVAVVGIAAYAVTLKVRVDYLEKIMTNRSLLYGSRLTN